MNSSKRSKRSKRSRTATLAVAAALACAAIAPSTAHADEDEGPPDARLTGFPKPVTNGGGSTALTWVGLAFLGVIAISPLFKDAKRTHLD